MKLLKGDLKLENIKLKQPVQYGKKKVYHIYYTNDGDQTEESEVVIQTPELIIPYSVLTNPEKDSLQFDCVNQQYVEYIKSIEDRILKKANRVIREECNEKTFLNCAKDTANGNVLRFRVKDANDVLCFDQDGKSISIQELKCERKIQLILWIKYLWIYGEYYGIEISVMQIKIHMMPQHCLFENETKDYSKYEKMFKMRIPMPAVEHKMRLDGMSDEDIEMFKKSTDKTRHQKPPETEHPAPQGPRESHTNNRPVLSFLAQIAGGNTKLKKVEAAAPPDDKTKIMNKISKYIDTSRKVPSLDEILDARSKLKRH